jgi:glucokinase
MAVAVDIGGTKIAAAAIDSNGHILAFSKIDTPGTAESVSFSVIKLIKGIIETTSSVAEPDGIGLAVAGTVDWSRGVIVQSPNLPYNNLALKDSVERAFGIAAFLDNDGNLAALGEKHFGVAIEARNFVGLTLGTGIGAGIIIDNFVYRGATGSAAELGHMVIDARGPQCTCGSFGCFEEMASGRALVRIAEERVKEPAAKKRTENGGASAGKKSAILELAEGDIDKITGSIVTEAANVGDPIAIECFKEVGYWLGIGINNIVNIFNPEIIAVGGGMAGAGELVLKPARDVVARQSLHPNKDVVSIVKAKLGNNAGLFGAAALVFSELI